MWSTDDGRCKWSFVAVAVIAAAVLGGPAVAQTSGSVQIVKEGKKYVYQGKEIKTPGDLKPIVANHPEAAAEASKSSTYRGVALVFGAVGGGLIGWPIGEALGGSDEPHWALAGVGAGALAVAIWSGVTSDKHFKKAIEVYNGGASTSMTGVRWELAVDASRLAVVARF